MRVKITEVNPNSMWYSKKERAIGKIFTVDGKIYHSDNGWSNASFEGNPSKDVTHIHGFKYIEVPEEKTMKVVFNNNSKNACMDQMRREAGIDTSDPSAMSELGTLPKYCSDIRLAGELASWLNEHKIADTSNYWYCDYEQKPDFVKRSLFYKIREYSNLEAAYNRVVERHNNIGRKLTDMTARCTAAEQMRDHYKEVFTEATKSLARQSTVLSEALRDRDIHARTADNWQQKAIDANKRADEFIAGVNNRLDGMEQACQLMNDIMDEEESIIGKRLKFSTHGMKFEITIGNPYTRCQFYHHEWQEGWYSISKRNSKDQMDWKKAAVQSVENLCREWVGDRDIQASIFEALFAAHPELK
jgi:hypothetical protein